MVLAGGWSFKNTSSYEKCITLGSKEQEASQ